VAWKPIRNINIAHTMRPYLAGVAEMKERKEGKVEHIGKVLEHYPKNTEAQRKSSGTMTDQDDYGANPSCQVCRGLGRVHPMLPDGKPDYSIVVACSAPGCTESRRKDYEATEERMREKGVSHVYHNFENFKPVLGAEKTLAAFKDIALNPSAPPFLLIYGTTGNGKTHLCEAATTCLTLRGIDCRLWAVADLVANLKASFADNTTEAVVAGLKRLPAMIFDDWGQHYGSPWEEQKLEEIVLARERDGLITIITTNMELDKLPERIVSRGRDKSQAVILLNEALDYRPKKKVRLPYKENGE